MMLSTDSHTLRTRTLTHASGKPTRTLFRFHLARSGVTIRRCPTHVEGMVQSLVLPDGDVDDVGRVMSTDAGDPIDAAIGRRSRAEFREMFTSRCAADEAARFATL